MVTLALIGVGRWGKNYLRTAKSLRDIEIKYVCARNQQTLNLLPDTYIKTLSIGDLVKNKEIDGFIVATPAATHFAIAKQLLTEGCNLLIEKPLATTYEQALELQKIWQIQKPRVLVGHLYLYNPAYQVFKKLFKNIKKVRSISFEALSSPVRKDVPVIWDWGPHPTSLLLDLIQQPIAKVSATGSEDTVEALLQFTNGIEASINISWFGPHKIRKLTIEGENKRIELDDTNTTNQKILLYQPNKPPQYPKYRPAAALTKELVEFVDAIHGFKKITSDINTGVAVVKVLAAMEKSALEGGKLVKLDRFN